MSAVVQELCAVALATDEIREEYEQAAETYGEVPVKKDNRLKPRQRPHYKRYEVEPGEGTPNGLVSDGKGGLIDPTLNYTDDDRLAEDLRISQMAAPAFTYEEQQKLFAMVEAGVLSKEKLTEIMEYQAPAPGQTKEELMADKRTDLLKTIGEQDERMKKMEEMIAKLAANL